MLKIKITQRGAHYTINGETRELPVGEVLEFASLPGFLVGKCEVVAQTESAEIVTNDTERDDLRAQYTEITGGKIAPKTWGVKRLTEELEKLTAPE